MSEPLRTVNVGLIGLGTVGGVGTGVGLGAAGGQREREGEREEQRYEPFHGLLFPFKIVLYRYPS